MKNRPRHDIGMSSSFLPSKRVRKSSSGRSGHSSKERDANQHDQLTITSRQTAKPAGARSSSSKEENAKLNSSKDVIYIVIEDDISATTAQAKDSQC